MSIELDMKFKLSIMITTLISVGLYPAKAVSQTVDSVKAQLVQLLVKGITRRGISGHTDVLTSSSHTHLLQELKPKLLEHG